MRVVATVFVVFFARSGHPDRIARPIKNKNSPILRHSTIRNGAQKYLRDAGLALPIVAKRRLRGTF
jgi:hypothetical protein